MKKVYMYLLHGEQKLKNPITLQLWAAAVGPFCQSHITAEENSVFVMLHPIQNENLIIEKKNMM